MRNRGSTDRDMNFLCTTYACIRQIEALWYFVLDDRYPHYCGVSEALKLYIGDRLVNMSMNACDCLSFITLSSISSARIISTDPPCYGQSLFEISKTNPI